MATKANRVALQPSFTFFYGANTGATTMQSDLAGLNATTTATVKQGDSQGGQTLNPAYPTVFGFSYRPLGAGQ